MSEPRPNYITPAGYAALRARYEALFGAERPKLVETISWAAGNGDRSENGDYIYGRRRLREIDRELGHLSRRMKAAKVVDPARQADRTRIWFGATVTLADEDDAMRTVTLVGEDEADASGGRISWRSPMAHALKGAAIGDARRVTLPAARRNGRSSGLLIREERDSRATLRHSGPVPGSTARRNRRLPRVRTGGCRSKSRMTGTE